MQPGSDGTRSVLLLCSRNVESGLHTFDFGERTEPGEACTRDRAVLEPAGFVETINVEQECIQVPD